MTSAEEFIELYSSSKLNYPEAILLLQKQRVYIAYEPDAKIVADVLGIDIEPGTPEMPPVSIGYQNFKKVLSKLLQKGHKVAVGRKSKKNDPIFHQLNLVKIDLTLYMPEECDN